MQIPQSPGETAGAFYGWTVFQLILMAIVAAVVIAGMVFGRRLAHQRHRAERAAEERAEEAGVALPPAEGPVAAEAFAEPVAKKPDPDLPMVTPATKPAPEPAPVATDTRPLTTIKGLGPKVAAMLEERGITTIAQVAALTPAEADDLDARLGAFIGRMARDRWIDQAKLLTGGDTAAYEAEFGKLG